MVWRTWCPAGDQCRKHKSQLGKYPTEEAARDALRNHLLRSSYHIEADTFSAAWVDEMMLQAEILEDDDTQDASAASATNFPPRSPRALLLGRQRGAAAARWRAAAHATTRS